MSTPDELRSIHVHRAGNRESLFLGGDREMVMFSGVLAFALIFSAMNWNATIYGIMLWFIALYGCRQMAKADPKMRHVYLRNLRYAAYYRPRSTPWRVNSAGQGKQYQ